MPNIEPVRVALGDGLDAQQAVLVVGQQERGPHALVACVATVPEGADFADPGVAEMGRLLPVGVVVAYHRAVGEGQKELAPEAVEAQIHDLGGSVQVLQQGGGGIAVGNPIAQNCGKIAVP